MRNVIFDFGGVLLDLEPERCKAAFRELGFDEIDSLLDTAHQRGILDQMERGLITVDAFCGYVASRIRQSGRDADATSLDGRILDAWRSMADGIPGFRLDFIADLKAKGYHVAALSNTNVVHWAYCRPMFLTAGYEPETLFEHVWLSCDLHLAKPDPEVFRRVLALSGYEPHETLFVDDSETNCRVAASFGLNVYAPPMTAVRSGAPRVSDWREAVLQRIEPRS